MSVDDVSQDKAAHYRTEADKAMALAERAEGIDSRTQLLAIARAYRRLADWLDPPAIVDI